MGSKYKELEQLLDDMQDSDYWYDQGVLISDNIIDEFAEEDWHKLNDSLTTKHSETWFYFLLYTLSDHRCCINNCLKIFLNSLVVSKSNDNYEELLYLFFEFLQLNDFSDVQAELIQNFVYCDVANDFWKLRLLGILIKQNPLGK